MSGSRAISLIVNGVATDVVARTVADLVTEAGFGNIRVATARNGAFVPERSRAETKLCAGDRVEILTPRQGG
jgi:sulfur carrier protein